jgi:putative PEP-CTERM system histidine kinase
LDYGSSPFQPGEFHEDVDTPLLTYSTLSFALGSAAFLALLAQLLLVSNSAIRVKALVAAVAVTLGWELSGVYAGLTQDPVAWHAVGLLDWMRASLWTMVLLVIFRRNVPGARGTQGYAAPVFIKGLAFASFGLVLGSVLFIWLVPSVWPQFRAPDRLIFGTWLGVSIAGLALVEQLLRNSPESHKWAIKPICIGLGGAYAFDLYCFADAFLFGKLDGVVWSARGLAHALIVPFVALSIARTRGWKATLTVSRQIAFHSTALLASGLYLLAVASGGYYIREFGGEWARFLQVTFVFGAVLVLLLLFWSGTIRSRIRVWVSKHFFSYRFDYREQWLSFTRALSDHAAEEGIYERSVKALADLVESPGGGLWLKRDARWKQVARWSMPHVEAEEAADSTLTSFLSDKGWVVDLKSARARPENYKDLVLPGWLDSIPEAWIAVPLMAADKELFGFVILLTPRSGAELNWEVLDLLKTAARQSASYLAQIEANEALLEAKKFDAFNRLSAFVVHDLKNLVAQLSLLLKNAQRHKNNPEFQEDLLLTVGHVVKRMNDMLFQLRSGTVPVEQPALVELSRVLERIAQSKAAQRHRIRFLGGEGVCVLGHEERLERVVGHLVQNALEASEEESKVSVEVIAQGNEACIAVTDSGTGMTPEFIRDKLFKPFQSTKATGMGIGAYESHQYITSLGGRLLVESVPREGTKMTVFLPQARFKQAMHETA